jgi:hypothetical protein
MASDPRSAGEAADRLPDRADRERFGGYGVMGLPFAGGHYLALRHFPASSIGPGYDSVWLRDPGGRWTIFSSAPPSSSCPRYFAAAVDETVSAPITVTWPDPFALSVEVPHRLVWDLLLVATPATRAMTVAGRLLPAAAWRNGAVLATMSRIAGPMLGVGRVALTGTAPNGQSFQTNPRMLWAVADSHAHIDGVDAGRPGPLPEQAHLGDFWLPQRGMFAIGEAFFEPFDAQRHRAASPGA